MVVEIGIGVGVGDSTCATVHTAGESAMFAFGTGFGAVEAAYTSNCAGPGEGRFVGGRAPAFHAVDGAGRDGR